MFYREKHLGVEYILVGKLWMVKILKRCGYYVGDTKGKMNKKSNILDCALFTAYFILSLVNSFSTNPSNLVFALNTISISRLILKNYIEQCKIVSKFPVDEGYVSANITKVHFLKIMCEASALLSFLAAVCWNKFSGNASSAVILVVVFMLSVTWIENLLCMFERLYDAQPMPLVMCQLNKS